MGWEPKSSNYNYNYADPNFLAQLVAQERAQMAAGQTPTATLINWDNQSRDGRNFVGYQPNQRTRPTPSVPQTNPGNAPILNFPYGYDPSIGGYPSFTPPPMSNVPARRSTSTRAPMSALGGNSSGPAMSAMGLGDIVSGIVNPIGTAVGSLFGGSGFGGGDQSAPTIPDVSYPNYTGDAAQLNALQGQLNKEYGGLQQGITGNYGQQQQYLQGGVNQAYGQEAGNINNLYSQQQTDLKNMLDTQRRNAMQNLTTGPEGAQLMQKFNDLGLLDSGAFNQGLANQFAQLQQNEDQQLMQQGLEKYNALQNLGQQQLGSNLGVINQGANQYSDIRNLLGQQVGANIGLESQGTQRNLSLEDWYRNAQLQRALAQAGANIQVQLGNQQSQNQLLGGLMGLGGMLGGAAIMA